MSLTAEAPKLPKLPFILADVALLAVAALIAWRTDNPYAGGPLIAIVVCVALGAAALVIPFIADYGRKTDALLSERQDEIAALARTTAASAEQVSIAASSLANYADSSTRSAKTIESLPQRLQEKIAEFKTQLNEVTVSENEALEQELQALRSAESDRLVAALDQLTQTAAEIARLETAAKAQAAAMADTLAALPKLADQAGARVTENIAQAATLARNDLERAITQHHAALNARITALNTACAGLDDRITRMRETIAELSQAAARAPALEKEAPPPAMTTTSSSAGFQPASAFELRPEPTPAAREAPQKETLPEPKFADTTPAGTAEVEEESDEDEGGDLDALSGDPKRQGTAALQNASRLVDDTTEREDRNEDENDDENGGAAPAPSSPARARDNARFTAESPSTDAALSSDGATRLLVTAYIGIGNKLFLRGSGPGLSWERGVPLQFVSIGKWRWETMDTSAPIAGRLYKNDQIECSTVGMFTLEPGRQRELTATF